LDELLAALAKVAADLASHDSGGPARLHVDRSFTLRGIGTVATGTLWSGTIGEGDELRVEPRGRSVRVRSVQVHDRPVERAEAGQRVAVSLPGVERKELRRGDVLVTPGSLRPSFRLDVTLEWLDELRADLDRAIDAADPLDPGVPVPAAEWAKGVIPHLGLELRGAKLYRPGAGPELGERAGAAEALAGQLGLEPVRVEDRAL